MAILEYLYKESYTWVDSEDGLSSCKTIHVLLILNQHVTYIT